MKFLGTASAMLYLQSITGCSGRSPQKPFPRQKGATIYTATSDDPGDNTHRLVESLGGIEAIIGKEDIVILKPNSQWWNQGMTNTDIMAAFIEIVLAIPGFTGEVIIADSHQCQEDNSRGWTTEKRNGRFNLNELVEFFNYKGHPNVTKYHWRPAGPNPMPLQMDGFGDSVVSHPSEGDGYIWPDDLFYVCPYGHKCLLAYPVFTSAYSGVTIDLKDGAYKDGSYTGQPVKFINFSALNHHGVYVGATASIKNYMGVVDMSCGYPGPEPPRTYNTHHMGASNLFRLITSVVWRLNKLSKLPWFHDIYLHPSVFRFRYTGGVLGAFMREIRRADMNIITAVRVGWGSRVNTAKAFKANTVLASTDPVALDYWAAANILLPGTKAAQAPAEYVELNDPDIEDGPLRMFLEECRRELGGTLDPELINVVRP